MSHNSKSTYTLPRKTELHTSTPRLIRLRKNRKGLKPRLLYRCFKENDRSTKFALEDESSLFPVTLKCNQERSEPSSCDEETLDVELCSCFKNLTEIMKDVDEKSVVNVSKRLQSYPSVASVDWSTLYSNAAKLHAQDRLLVPCQQQKVEMVQAIEMMKAITECNFENVETGGKYSSTISVAQQLGEQYNRHLTASELIVLTLRNFWFDNLELKIGDNFMHVDRYLFQYFANAFADNSNYYLELPPHKASMHLMGKVYEWLINDNNELMLDSNFIAMYNLVKFLDVRRLLQQFWYNFAISDRFGFWEQDAFQAYLKARQISCNDMIAILLSRTRKCFLPLVASSEFLEMNVNEVIFIFKLDTICVNSEDEVFFAAVRWLEHNWSKRKEYLVQVMATIRVRMLSPWLQWSIIYKPENLVIKEFGTNCQVKAMLWDACLFGEASVANKQLSDECGKLLKLKYDQANEVQRYWVNCQGVPHHHDVKCPRYRKLTYEIFKLFLTRLQTYGQEFINVIIYVPQKHSNTYKCCEYSDSKHPKFVKRVNPSIYNIYDI
ncbi:uncharacterized protein LOC117782092 [Drosophila innubila]|uniref:uncharacterized protein LOC117782092 n=1 Tax=Drosophila innubila TaxID=198719 RepID=UPI00148D5400|nr:uncharacterized protein LOC117782092 [Drosophila innubila]